MARSVTVEVDGVGDVLLEKSKKSKHLNIYVMPLKGVRVAVPYGVPFEEAEKMVKSRSKIKWMKKHLAVMKKMETEYAPDLKGGITDAQAKWEILCRVRELSHLHGFKVNRVFIRRQKTRWGSCSHKNNINLNIKLAVLPDELHDYVILHELLHTKVKSHGKPFWSEMEKLMENPKRLDARLKEYHLELI